MRADTPRVSVGMPVYNGERYLSDAIDSLLGQTFTDFELIIADNASTDRTEEICRSYAARDDRIRYVRNQQNVGALNNFNITFQLSSGEYFMWAAHDDVRAPACIARCVDALDASPASVLAYAETMIIDEQGTLTDEHEIYTFRTDSSRQHIRFYDLIRTPHRCFQILGMMRTSELAKTPLLGLYTSSDIVLLAELSLLGPFQKVPETLVYYRRHPLQSVQLDRRTRMAWSDSIPNRKMTFPHWRLYWELWACIQRVPLHWLELFKIYSALLCWPFWYPNWRRMAKDVVAASTYLLASVIRSMHRSVLGMFTHNAASLVHSVRKTAQRNQ